jgi:hypothetical protein
VRKWTRRYHHDDLVVIPGRSLAHPDSIYVEVRTPVPVDSTHYKGVRWYFKHKPTKDEILTAIETMIGELT